MPKTGRENWQGKGSFITYFSCLGLGFIIFELVFIQLFMKLIGFPLYTYTTVLFTFLFGAGIGSLASEKMQLMERGKTWVPFVGVILATIVVVVFQQFAFDALLEQRTLIRIGASIAAIFPLAFFLGMPFPMGVLAIREEAQRYYCLGMGTQWIVYNSWRDILCCFFSVLRIYRNDVGCSSRLYFGILCF